MSLSHWPAETPLLSLAVVAGKAANGTRASGCAAQHGEAQSTCGEELCSAISLNVADSSSRDCPVLPSQLLARVCDQVEGALPPRHPA